MDVKEANLLEERAGAVLVDRGDVDHAQTAGVVGLVRDAVDNVLVVVDADGGALVDAGEDGPARIWVRQSPHCWAR